MKTMYEAPIVEIIKFSSFDIITTSDGKGENATPDDDLFNIEYYYYSS